MAGTSWEDATEVLHVFAAALGAFAFGGVWSTSPSEPWMAAAGIPMHVSGKPAGNGSQMPFAIGMLAMIVVAGMMRHIFVTASIVTVGGGIGAWGVYGAALVGNELRLWHAQTDVDAD